MNVSEINWTSRGYEMCPRAYRVTSGSEPTGGTQYEFRDLSTTKKKEAGVNQIFNFGSYASQV
jgi:hypothetical protein